jgi:hypothetical protein
MASWGGSSCGGARWARGDAAVPARRGADVTVRGTMGMRLGNLATVRCTGRGAGRRCRGRAEDRRGVLGEIRGASKSRSPRSSAPCGMSSPVLQVLRRSQTPRPRPANGALGCGRSARRGLSSCQRPEDLLPGTLGARSSRRPATSDRRRLLAPRGAHREGARPQHDPLPLLPAGGRSRPRRGGLLLPGRWPPGRTVDPPRGRAADRRGFTARPAAS